MRKLNDITDRDALLKAMDEFDELGREQFLAKYKFKKSTAFYIDHDGKRYDSKPILGAAHGYQYPELGPLAWNEFSGGELTTRRHLEGLGFVVVRTATMEPEDDDLLPIGQIIDEVCVLQQSWSKDTTPEMQERRRLVTREGPRSIRALLPPASTLPFSVEVRGKENQGNNAKVAYIRIYSKSHSPSATAGWYVVLLFAADGSGAYLTLGTGVTVLEKGSYRTRDEKWLAERIAWARELLGEDAGDLLTEIDLADPGGKGDAYERGTVFAYAFPPDSQPDDEDFAKALEHLLGMLSELYSREEHEKAVEEAVGDIEEGVALTVAFNRMTLDWLRDETLWGVEELHELLDALSGPSPQVILAGPPGTGKSWVAQAVARYLTLDSHRLWRLVQFHPSYGYESFIEGLRPVVNDEGAISFARVDGTVLRMAEAARLNEAPHVLILDEMNRANVPRVLGELMFLFEYRNRMIDLQYSQGFALPKNLLFIATMNTADRSIRSIDVALRRRFEIFECLPDVKILKAFYDRGLGKNTVGDLFDGFVALNDELGKQLDRHHTIGQTFFMAAENTPERMRRVWARKIFPLIEEYFFDVPDLAEEFSVGRFWPSLGA